MSMLVCPSERVLFVLVSLLQFTHTYTLFVYYPSILLYPILHLYYYTCRLYGCLRIACGWILYNIRLVDDGRFRRSVCEGLCACYLLQAAAVLRAQFTDRHTWLNWVAILVLSLVGTAYGAFRFGQGGNHIKIYELPTAGSLQ